MGFTIPVGNNPSDPVFKIPVTGTTEDVVRSAGAGLRRGIEGIPGMPGDIAGLSRAGIGKIAGLMGADPETVKAINEYDIPYLPDISSQTIHAATTPLFGESYKPQTTAGKYTAAAGEFLPAFISNPAKGGAQFVGKLALGATAGLASEAAGQATEGTSLEPWARTGAGLLAGGGGHALTAGREALATAPGRAAEIAAEDAALKHGVQLTKGQRSGDVSQQMAEQQMLKGGRGELAQQMMQGRDTANTAALGQAIEGLKDKVAPTRGADPVQAGDLLNQSVRERVGKLKSEGGKQIEDALKSGVMVNADTLRDLPKTMRGNLAGSTPFVPDVVLGPNTPIASEAMDRLSTFASQANDPRVKEFSLAGSEELRRQIGQLYAQPGTTDARALGKIQRYFDDWLENAVGGGRRVGDNMLPGEQSTSDILDQLKQGRSVYGSGARVERPRGPERQQPGAKSISSLALTNHPEDTRRLFTPTDRGTLSGQAIDALDRLVSTGATKTDLDQVRGIVLSQLTTGFPGKKATRITNFINENPTAAKALFSPEELDQLSSWGATNKQLVPNPNATNPSGTSFPLVKEIKKAAGKQATATLGTMGGVLGGFPGALLGIAGGGVASFLEGMSNKRAAVDALTPADRRTLAEIMARAGRGGAMRSLPGALSGGSDGL